MYCNMHVNKNKTCLQMFNTVSRLTFSSSIKTKNFYKKIQHPVTILLQLKLVWQCDENSCDCKILDETKALVTCVAFVAWDLLHLHLL